MANLFGPNVLQRDFTQNTVPGIEGLIGQVQGGAAGGGGIKEILLKLLPLILSGGLGAATGGKTGAGAALTGFGQVTERGQVRKERREERESDRQLARELQRNREEGLGERQQTGLTAQKELQLSAQDYQALAQKRGFKYDASKTDKLIKSEEEQLGRKLTADEEARIANNEFQRQENEKGREATVKENTLDRVFRRKEGALEREAAQTRTETVAGARQGFQQQADKEQMMRMALGIVNSNPASQRLPEEQKLERARQLLPMLQQVMLNPAFAPLSMGGAGQSLRGAGTGQGLIGGIDVDPGGFFR